MSGLEAGTTITEPLCGSWCFMLGLSANGVGCELTSNHEGEHQLTIASNIAPRATFKILWTLEQDSPEETVQEVQEETIEEEKEEMNDSLLEKAVEAASQAPTNPSRSVPLGPIPMSWNISQTQSSEGPIIVINVQTPDGDRFYFLEPSIAKQLGEALTKLSSATESGLILP